MDDVVELLTRQHRELEAALESLLQARDLEQRTQWLEKAGDDLAVHLSAEEQVFYPAVQAARTEDILLESLEEHLSLKRLLADLLRMAPSETTFQAKCKVLEEQARHHHKEEEQHLFPKVGRLLDATRLQELGSAVRSHEAALRRQGESRMDLLSQTMAAEPLPSPARAART